MKRFTKYGITATLAALVTIGAASSALAAGWQKNSSGWWYATNTDNTTWHVNGWQWIDGNGDGVSECYYFDGNGYLITNGTTPDGYNVNSDGQWMINNAVQTKGGTAQQTQGSVTQQTKGNAAGKTALETLLSSDTTAAVEKNKIIIADSGTKYSNPLDILVNPGFEYPMSFDLNGKYTTMTFMYDMDTVLFDDLHPTTSTWKKMGAELTMVDENDNVIWEDTLAADNEVGTATVNVTGVKKVSIYCQPMDSNRIKLILKDGFVY